MQGVGVRVEGLAELRRELRRVGDTDNLRQVREALKKAANVVAESARARVPTRSGTAAGSIRATAGGNKAFVVGGKASVPYYGWLDFGSRTPRRGQSRSTGPWSHSGKGPHKGRFIYPAIDDTRPQIVDTLEDALAAAFKQGGF